LKAEDGKWATVGLCRLYTSACRCPQSINDNDACSLGPSLVFLTLLASWIVDSRLPAASCQAVRSGNTWSPTLPHPHGPEPPCTVAATIRAGRERTNCIARRAVGVGAADDGRGGRPVE